MTSMPASLASWQIAASLSFPKGSGSSSNERVVIFHSFKKLTALVLKQLLNLIGKFKKNWISWQYANMWHLLTELPDSVNPCQYEWTISCFHDSLSSDLQCTNTTLLVHLCTCKLLTRILGSSLLPYTSQRPIYTSLHSLCTNIHLKINVRA